MTTALINRAKDEEGLALLVAVILLLMISAIGLTALQSAQEEAAGSGRSRRKTATLAAASAALELVAQQLDVGAGYPKTDAINLPTFMTDQWGGNTAVRTGTADTATAQEIKSFKLQLPGNALNVGSKNTLVEGLYRANVVATDSSGGVVEVQAQFKVRHGSAGYN